MLSGIYLKLAGAALIVLAIGGGVSVGYAKYQRAVAQRQTAIAEAALKDLEAEKTARKQVEENLALEQANVRVNAELARAEAEKRRVRETEVAQLVDEVNRERKALPKKCDRALDPVRDALAGLQRLRVAPSGAGASPAAPRPVPPGVP